MSSFDVLARTAESGLAAHQVPGAALGVWHAGSEQTAAAGTANVEAGPPVTADTRFLIASNTKPFTAVTAMRLVEQGKLDLHAPLRRYVPELRLADPAVAEAVTLWHCLTHTSGWLGDHAPDTGRGDDAIARAVASMVELPQLTPVGEVWSYNNIGFTLAGRAIELAAGEPYEAAARRLLLEPLGMSCTCFFPEEAIGWPTAAGHNVSDGQPRLVRPWTFPRSANPMGGLISCVRDMLRWARFNLSDGEGLLRPETMRMIQARQADAGSSCDAVGIAWMLWNVGGQRVVGHGGYAPGQMSAFRFVPGRDLALFVATNSDHGSRLHGEVTAAFNREYLGVEAGPPVPVELSRERLAELVGRYTAVLDDVEIGLDGDGLILRTTAVRWLGPTEPAREVPPPTRLAVVANDTLVALDPPLAGARAEVLRDADGVAWLRWGGRIHRRAR